MSNQRFSFTENNTSHLGINMIYLASVKYEGEWQSNLHTHHFPEIYYVTKGLGEFRIEDKHFPVKENNLIIVNPHVEHTEFSSKEAPLEFVSLGIEGMIFEFDKAYKNQNYAIYNCDGIKDRINSVLQLLLSEAEEEGICHELACQNLAEMFVIYAMRMQNFSLQPSLDTKMSKECGAAKRYIDSNYMENITLDLLADLTHMNKFYLVHSFTKYTGLSPINYLTQKRIQVAMEYLASTDYSVAQIASSVGFSSQSYFSQVFRKALGITPVQFRKQHIKNISPLASQ